MLTKYANIEVVKVGALKDMWNDLKADPFWSQHLDSVMQKHAALEPVARYLDDFIYTRQRSVSAEEFHGPNGNWDSFPDNELRSAYATFINTGFFKDHVNHDRGLAYGINLDSRYHPDHFVETIAAIGWKMQPDSGFWVPKIAAGEVNQVSMGVEVGRSICSYCANEAVSEADYCDHVRFMKGAMLDGERVFERNTNLNFFEQSFITTEAAEKHARIAEVFTKEDLMKSLAAQKENQKHLIFSFMRMPHLSVKPCTGCAHKAKSATTNNSDNREEYTMSSGKDLTAEAKVANEKPAVKTAEESSDTKVTKTQVDAGDYPRSVKPEDAAFDQSKKSSEAASPTTVADKDKISQQEREDYVRSSQRTAAQKRRQALLKNIAKMLSKAVEDDMGLSLPEGEVAAPKEPGIDGLNVDVQELHQVKDKAQEGIAAAVDALNQIDSQKSTVLAKLQKTRLAHIRKGAEATLEDLQKAETQVVDHKHALEDVLKEVKEFEVGLAKGEESLHLDDVKQMHSDVSELVEETKAEIADILSSPDQGGEMKPEEKKDAPEEKAESKSEEKDEKKDEAKEEGKDEKKDEKKGEEKEASKKTAAEGGSAAPGKKEAGNPQIMVDRGDYPRSTDPVSAAAAEAKKSSEAASPTNTQDKDRITQQEKGDYPHEGGEKTAAAKPDLLAEAQKELKVQANRFYKGLRQVSVSHEAAVEKVASWLKGVSESLPKKVAEGVGGEDLKKQIVDEVSDKLVSEILNTNPEGAPAMAGAAEVGQPPAAATPEESKSQEMFGTPPVTVSSKKTAAAGEVSSEETKAPAASGSEEPSDPYWDLFPEDKVTEQVGKANSEAESRLRQDMKGTYVPASASAESKTSAKTAAQEEGLDEAKLAESLALAQSEVEAGMIGQADLESEARRLFLMDPSTLKATAELVKRAQQKEAFQHPDADDPSIMKSAMTISSDGGSGLEGGLFDD